MGGEVDGQNEVNLSHIGGIGNLPWREGTKTRGRALPKAPTRQNKKEKTPLGTNPPGSPGKGSGVIR